MTYELIHQSKSLFTDGSNPINYDITQCSRLWSWDIVLHPDALERPAGGWEFTAEIDNVKPASIELSAVMTWEVFDDTVHLLLSLHSESPEASPLRTFPFTARLVVRRFDEVALTLSLRHRGYSPAPYVDIKQVSPL